MSLDPLVYKVLSNWREEAERPPLLLNGSNESDWELLLEDIIRIFTDKPIKMDHPDILILKRDPKKQGIEVKQTREFISQLSLSNYELPFKLGIIPAAEQLNIQSQNALLKTLEEPLKKRYLIMSAGAKNKLLPTILSRVTILNIKPNTGIHSEMLLQGGAINLYQNCLDYSLPERLQKGQVWSEGNPEKINEFFNAVISMLRAELSESFSKENIKTAREITGQLETALSYSEQLGRTSGANPKLLFESFLLQMPRSSGMDTKK